MQSIRQEEEEEDAQSRPFSTPAVFLAWALIVRPYARRMGKDVQYSQASLRPVYSVRNTVRSQDGEGMYSTARLLCALCTAYATEACEPTLGHTRATVPHAPTRAILVGLLWFSTASRRLLSSPLPPTNHIPLFQLYQITLDFKPSPSSSSSPTLTLSLLGFPPSFLHDPFSVSYSLIVVKDFVSNSTVAILKHWVFQFIVVPVALLWVVLAQIEGAPT